MSQCITSQQTRYIDPMLMLARRLRRRPNINPASSQWPGAQKVVKLVSICI